MRLRVSLLMIRNTEHGKGSDLTAWVKTASVMMFQTRGRVYIAATAG